MVSMNDLFSTENKYRVQEDRIKNSKPNSNQIVVGIHRRVSTDRQVLEGDSLEMQSELAQKHVQHVGGYIYKYYTEEGLSAKKTALKDRDVMQEIIQDIQDGKINYLVAYRRDRLFRNQAENMWFWSLLAENDCQIFLTASGETQVKIDDLKKAGTTKMMESILAMMAEMESEITSTRVADTMLSMAKRGEYTGGSIPIGYTRDEDGKFIPKVGIEELVQTIEDLYLQGYGMHSIARFLNAEDVRGLPKLEFPVPKPIEGDKSNIWNHRNINTLLFNPFYTGHLSYESKKNTDVDRVITKVDYITPIRTLKRQKQLNAFKNKKNEGMKAPRAYNTPFLLSGLVYCEECGERLNTHSTTRKDKKFSYYRCANKSNTYLAKGCSNRGYNKDVLESLVVKVTRDKIKMLISEEYIGIFNKKIELDKISYSNEYQKVEKEIKSKEREFSNLTRMIIKIENEGIQAEYMKEQEKLLSEINNLKESLSKLMDDASNEEKVRFNYQEFYDLAHQYGDIVEVAPVAVQKQMIESLFTNIYVDKKGEVTMQVRSGIGEILDLSSVEGTNADEDNVIGFGTGRSPMVAKDITLLKNAISKFTISFNYFEYQEEVAKFFFDNLKNYVFDCIPEVNPDNADHVNLADLKHVNLTHYADEKLKNQHIARVYFMEKGNFGEVTQRAFFNSSSMKLSTVEKILEFANSDILEYLKYLDDIDTELVITNIDALSTILYTYSDKVKILPDEKFQHVIFKDLIYCACGHKSYRKINRTSPVTYECKTRRNKYNLEKCKYKSAQEEILIETVFKEKGVRIKNRREAEELIHKIVYRSKNDFDIIYKQ